MQTMSRCIAVFALVLATSTWADDQTPQTLRVIPKAYVSPGASGSIDSSERYRQYDIYGGQAVPRDSGSSHYESQRFETRGGIRQTTEYPGGHEVQRYPGQSTQQRYQRR